MESYNSNNDKPKISLNRKKRMWNRYRNYIAGLAVLVVAVIIVAIVLKSCSNKNSDRQDDTKVTTSPVQQESTAPVIQESKEPAENVTGQTTAAASGRSQSSRRTLFRPSISPIMLQASSLYAIFSLAFILLFSFLIHIPPC